MRTDWWAHVYPIFKPEEFVCRCGQCEGSKVEGAARLMVKESVLRVHALRMRLGVPAIVTSGYRCPAHNQRVSSTGAFGPHTTGQAVDIAWHRAVAYEVQGHVKELGITGVGYNQKGNSRFMHFDDLPNIPGQPRPTVWSY